MNFSVGTALKPISINAISTEVMKEWAIFLRDPNPIHLDLDAVKAQGLGDRLINQGPINVAYVMNMLMENFPGCKICEMETRFIDNAYGGEAVATFGTITAIEESDQGRRLSCEVGLKSAERDLIIAGTATVLLPT